jgi:hypothetical protein
MAAPVTFQGTSLALRVHAQFRLSTPHSSQDAC